MIENSRRLTSAQSSSYARLDIAATVMGSTPHQLIALLFSRTQQAVAAALIAAEKGEAAVRNRQLGRATELLAGLSGALDMARGGAVAVTLAQAYDDIRTLLGQAILSDEVEYIRKAHACVGELASAWDSIG